MEMPDDRGFEMEIKTRVSLLKQDAKTRQFLLVVTVRLCTVLGSHLLQSALSAFLQLLT